MTIEQLTEKLRKQGYFPTISARYVDYKCTLNNNVDPRRDPPSGTGLTWLAALKAAEAELDERRKAKAAA